MLVLLNWPMISPTNKPLPGFELTSPDVQGLVLKVGYFPWCTSCRERINCEQIMYGLCHRRSGISVQFNVTFINQAALQSNVPHCRVGISQLVECVTKKSGAILMWFNSPVWLGIFHLESTFNGDCLMVFAQSPRAITCNSICVHIKNPKH